MSYIETGDYAGNPVRVQAEVNNDGTLSPVYGLSASALAAIEAGPTGGATSEKQDDTIDAISALLLALQALAPATEHVAVTPSDVTNLTGVRGLYIGGGGNVAATVNGVDVIYTAVPAGAMLPIRATKVKSTGTTATGIVAWK